MSTTFTHTHTQYTHTIHTYTPTTHPLHTHTHPPTPNNTQRVHSRSADSALGVFSLNLYEPSVMSKPGHPPAPPTGHVVLPLATQLPLLLQGLLPRCLVIPLDTHTV